MEQQAETSVVRRRKHPRRWMPGDVRQKAGKAAGEMLRFAGRVTPVFLMCFADMMGIPSGLYASYMAALGAMGESMLWPGCGCILALVMRLVWGLPLRLEIVVSAGLMLMAPAVVFGKGILRLMGWTALSLAAGAGRYLVSGTAEQALTATAGIVIGALSAPVLLRAMRVMRSGKAIASMEERVAVGYLCALLLCGAGRMLFFGLNLGALGAAFATVCMGVFLGVAPGVLAGMMSGLTLALQGLPLGLSVALALGGFVGGMAQCLGRRWLSCCAFALGCGMAMVLVGAAGYGCMLAAGTSAVLLAVLPRESANALQNLCRRFLPVQTGNGDGYAGEALRRWEKTMTEMASAVPVPDAEDGPRTSSWWKCRLCAGCPDDAQCSSMLTEVARDHAEHVWQCRNQDENEWRIALENLRGLGCGRLYYLRDSMETLRCEDMQRVKECLRLQRQRDMLVTHLSAMAQSAQRFAQLSTGESWWDDLSARQLRRALAEAAFAAQLVYARRVQGHARVCFELQRESGAEQQAEELRELCNRTLDVPMQLERVENGRVLLAEKPLWQVQCATACSGAQGSETCGDTSLYVPLEDGKYLVVLSDGMGHGETARRESKNTVRLIQLCLEAGYSRQQTLTAVNGMLMLSSKGERFATVDMVIVDLWTGRLMLDKLGAAASWLIRGREMQEITGDGLPLGMLEDVDSQGVCLRIREGDQLLMMTDGVEEAVESREKLREALLRAADAKDASAAAWMLLRSAEEGEGQGCQDDRTVAVMRFAKASAVQKDAAEV